MSLQETLCFPAESYEFGPYFLHTFAQLGDIDWTWWHACENELGEQRVGILGGFEVLEA